MFFIAFDRFTRGSAVGLSTVDSKIWPIEVVTGSLGINAVVNLDITVVKLSLCFKINVFRFYLGLSKFV